MTLNYGRPSPTGTPAQYAAVRRALRVWRVDSVVVSTDPAAPFLQQGQDPVYAAAFMTAALGRLPRIQAGAWVWDDVQADTTPPLPTGSDTLGACTQAAEGGARRLEVTMRAPVCVGLRTLAHPLSRRVKMVNCGHPEAERSLGGRRFSLRGGGAPSVARRRGGVWGS